MTHQETIESLSAPFEGEVLNIFREARRSINQVIEQAIEENWTMDRLEAEIIKVFAH